MKSTPVWKVCLFSFLLFILFFLGAECIARILIPQAEARIQKEHEKVITILGLPTLNEIMEFDPYLFWKLKDAVHNKKISGKIKQYEIDFTVNISESLRVPTFKSNKKKFRILALGDSTTFGLGVDDKETWPFQLQNLLKQKGFDVEVINAGVPGYTAFQGKRFFEKKGPAINPDLLIVNFGFNDIEEWGSRSDFETAQDLNIENWESTFIRSRFYILLKKLITNIKIDKKKSQQY